MKRYIIIIPKSGMTYPANGYHHSTVYPTGMDNAVNTIQTNGSVIVKSTDNVTFEAGQEIQMNAGFEVQQGGKFEVNIVQCGN